MPVKYYAVRAGKTPGIYDNWKECKEMVTGFPGAVYKSFRTLQEAEEFLGPKKERTQGDLKEPEAYAFVDGSFHAGEKIYGYGGFLVHHGKKEILQGAGRDPEMASMRNVAGEVQGSRAAIEKALELGLKDLTIYYDYMGIEMWASGAWKRNKAGTAAYYEYVQSVKDRIDLHFVKVKGHSGVEGNEEADRLAKEAVEKEKSKPQAT